MKTEQRLYVAEQGGTKRLIRAANPAVVRNHVARDTIQVKVATTMEVFELAQAGAKVEETSAEPAQRQMCEPT